MSNLVNQLPVEVVRWPGEAAAREACQRNGTLCLLVLEKNAPAPVLTDLREDWVRAPVPHQDLAVRIAMLRARAARYAVPELDASGILRFRSRSVVLSPTERALVAELLRHFRALTTRESLLRCLPGKDGDTSNALHLHIMRLRRRIAPLGLVIKTLWNQGYQLGPADPRFDQG
ncbi:Transcriptional regulatory protein, C terminal [Lentzea xinjiangensis]|uniref:Transcriptional regulatory protein, C terminal n=1 Tax=Lentzea xinjiangensis TaxID=402600 RepID=A0A1H9QJT2_9PSEU|nr:helix-turn-helix domain-containing protein [Lentzea xinjiangensis]SER60455.1 Transcriptional regulatory protein, C terminal [Lentzea xinjiangensis]